MAELSALSAAQVVLLATQLATDSNIPALAQLRTVHPTVLHVELTLRIILTFLPESTDTTTYLSFIQDVIASPNGPSTFNKKIEIDLSSVTDLTPAAARKQVGQIQLLPLRYPRSPDDAPDDTLVSFVIHRAHRIDSETGLQPLALQLIAPFAEQDLYVRRWLISTLLPLLRFNYEYYHANTTELALDSFETLDAAAAVNTLLSKTETTQVGRDLRGLVGPWMYGGNVSKRRKITPSQPETDVKSGWDEVNQWLVSASVDDFDVALHAVETWNGPGDEDLGGYELSERSQSGVDANSRREYARAALSTIYATSADSTEALAGSSRIIDRVAELSGLNASASTRDIRALPDLDLDLESLSRVTQSSLRFMSLLSVENLVTSPTQVALDFGNALVTSATLLRHLHHPATAKETAEICVAGSEEVQQTCLRKILGALSQHQKSVEWTQVRRQLLWLRSWKYSVDDPATKQLHGLFWRLGKEYIEVEILKTLLYANQYDLVVHAYLNDPESSPLSLEQVEDVVQQAILTSYDTASNGNRTRGGMKRASEILKTFRAYFPASNTLKHDEALLAATHALSFYSLTLQHGVPFQPVSIRVHQDPIALIGKILDQNPNSYTKLDDLLFIGQNLVDAGLPVCPTPQDAHHHILEDEPRTHEQMSLIVSRRITSLAITSALSSDDFGTAYSYVLTRLLPPSFQSFEVAKESGGSSLADDVSYLAAYNAGRHVSSTPPSNRASHITHASQRMELLSLALILASNPDPLPEILATWRRVDEEMSLLRAQEAEEEENWDTRGDQAMNNAVPGGFGPSSADLDASEVAARERARRARTRAAGDEEAPMGLFDVARGAAAAFQRSAFPLHGRNTSASGNNNNANPANASAKGSVAASPTHSRTPSNRFSIGGMSMSLSGSGLLNNTTGGGGGAQGQAHASHNDNQSLYSNDGAGSMHESYHSDGGEERVRKRDVVSNMVTGGLVSGLGWVLGAQPAQGSGGK